MCGPAVLAYPPARDPCRCDRVIRTSRITCSGGYPTASGLHRRLCTPAACRRHPVRRITRPPRAELLTRNVRSAAQTRAPDQEDDVITELRRYRIKPGRMESWIAF